jgi:hypothetical protein
MAVPWQSDFSACFFSSDYAWWPAQRPDEVTRGGADNQDWAKDFGQGADEMIATWDHLGFVVPDGNEQVEKERFAICKDIFIVTDRNEFSMDEVDAMLAAPPAKFSPSFYVVVEGFTPQELGFTSPNPPNLAAIAPQTTFILPSASPSNHMHGVVEQPLLQDPSLTVRQRVTFEYRVEFDGPQDFLDNSQQPIEKQDLTLQATIMGLTATAPVRLINKPNPYMIDGDVSWLSKDVRVFQVEENTGPFQSLPNLKVNGNDADAARAFIVDVIDQFNMLPQAGHPFDGISTDQATSKLEPSMYVGGKRIFNFAVAHVRYRAKSLPADDVRVFFRMFTVAATGTEYRPLETYRRFESGGNAIALLGLQAGDIVTLPFFAEKRETVKDLTTQTDPKNIRTLSPAGTDEFHAYFGCWLDFNQDQPLFPLHPVPQNGPFTTDQLTIQQLIQGKHQCLIAEVFYGPDPIPNQATPGSSDQLAQRNLLIVSSDNPGAADSHTIAHPFLIGARRGQPVEVGMRAINISRPLPNGPDELMIRWGNLPRTSDMRVYLPGIAANDVLHAAALAMNDPSMERVDDHTVRLLPADVSFVPIPQADHRRAVPGLLQIIVPEGVRAKQQFQVVLHHVSRIDRKIVGSFQLTIPVDHGPRLLREEMRLYSVMRYVFRTVPHESLWYSVFNRYLAILAARITGFGGDPDLVIPSAGGGESPAEWRWKHSLRGRLCNWLCRILRRFFSRFRWFRRCLCGPQQP